MFASSNVTARPLYHGRHPSPIGISFACSRSSPQMDPRIAHVFKHAIDGQAHLDMTQNSSCSHGQDAGPCGNLRGHLTECRCEILNRCLNPDVRTNYENEVIETIFNLLGQSTTPFHLKLAIFCSGRLLGEEILLFRLIHALMQKNRSGTLELFFIDQCYQPAIQNARHAGTFEDAIGGEKYIYQFLNELAQCLPTTITVQGTFFASDTVYIGMAQANLRFRHDLLVGADIENTNSIMGRIGREAGLGRAKPITLIKTMLPQVCELDFSGNLENCHDPRRRRAREPEASTQLTRESNTNMQLIFCASAAGVLALMIFLYLRSRRSTR